ncbi:MAG: hypothetical protein PVI50_05190 [Gammaproteobacteria bacterium]|jgi:ABC-2 type transport system permease protein
MVGRMLPLVVIGLVQLTLLILAGLWLFAMPVSGRVRDLYCAALLCIVANPMRGLLIPTAARSRFRPYG